MDEETLLIAERLVRIETKLDSVLSQHQDHENRLRGLERWKYAMPLTMFVAVGNIVAYMFTHVVGR